MVVDKLYKMDSSTRILRCISKDEVGPMMKEFQEGVCGSHIGGRALSGKIF